jgi:hypothetical protein
MKLPMAKLGHRQTDNNSIWCDEMLADVVASY